MEAMSVPATAIVAIVIACIVLIMAISEQEATSSSGKVGSKNSNKQTSAGDRMVWQFLLSDRNDSASLFHEMAISFGHKAEWLVRKALDEWILGGRNRVDRAYALKGYTLSRLGDQAEAERYYRLALVKNPDCTLAQLGLARFVARATPIDEIEMIRSSASVHTVKVYS